MRKLLFAGSLAALAMSACSCAGSVRAAEPSGPVLPDGLGVNIHFTDPKAGEMKMLADGGFRWVRMDFGWNSTERERGKYDFAAYDRLMAALEPHGTGALFILDYSNKLYDNGLSPCSDEGRRAFAQWAAAAVEHFKGRGILWEMYNEPNIGFWKPKPDVRAYVKLALEVGKAIRQAAPAEAYIGPATSGMDFAFLEECFKAGLLEYWSAVSVHPYRQEAPETAAADYTRLRRMIGQYAPKRKSIAILSGEWGYSSAWNGMNDEKQAKMLARQWLVNLSNDVPLSIWYDWHDDGRDPKEAEHHFGTVLNPYFAGRDPVYDAKPAYLAARTLATVLAGFRFNKRLVAGPDEYVLLFSKGDEVRVVAWTTAAQPHPISIPAGPGRFAVTSHTGGALTPVSVTVGDLNVMLTDSPQYLVPETPNDALRVAAAWERAPLEIYRRAGGTMTIPLAFRNPLDRLLRVAARPGESVDVPPGKQVTLTTTFESRRSDGPRPVYLECIVPGVGRLQQVTQFEATNPLRIVLLPPEQKAVSVRIENPTGEAFTGTAVLTDALSLRPVATAVRLIFEPGQREKIARFPLEQPVPAAYCLGVRVSDERNEFQAVLAPANFRLVDDFARYRTEPIAEAYQVAADGDAKVASTQSVSVGAPPEGPPAPGVPTLKIAYDFDAGWKFVRLAPRADAMKAIEGRPKALGVWVYGDGSGNLLRLRFTDSGGQTFQPNGEPMKSKGWRYVEFPMDGSRAGHWGGANDGVVHYPIRWDTLLLIDGAGRQKTSGEVYLAWPTLLSPVDASSPTP